MNEAKDRINDSIAGSCINGIETDCCASLVVLFLISLFLFPTNSFAAVFDVTDSAGLRSALAEAQDNGEADTINIAAGTYNTGGTTFTYTAASEENFLSY